MAKATGKAVPWTGGSSASRIVDSSRVRVRRRLLWKASAPPIPFLRSGHGHTLRRPHSALKMRSLHGLGARLLRPEKSPSRRFCPPWQSRRPCSDTCSSCGHFPAFRKSATRPFPLKHVAATLQKRSALKRIESGTTFQRSPLSAQRSPLAAPGPALRVNLGNLVCRSLSSTHLSSCTQRATASSSRQRLSSSRQREIVWQLGLIAQLD